MPIPSPPITAILKDMCVPAHPERGCSAIIISFPSITAGVARFKPAQPDRDWPVTASRPRLRREAFRAGGFHGAFSIRARSMRSSGNAWRRLTKHGKSTIRQGFRESCLIPPAACSLSRPPKQAAGLQFPARSARSRDRGVRPRKSVFRFSADKTACASRERFNIVCRSDPFERVHEPLGIVGAHVSAR